MVYREKSLCDVYAVTKYTLLQRKTYACETSNEICTNYVQLPVEAQ